MTIYSTVLPTVNPEYRIFPLRHNFVQPIRETVEFKTDIIESANGKEQRRAVRNISRRTMSHYATYNEREKWALDRFMYVGLNKPTLVADERYSVTLRAPMAPHQQNVLVDGNTSPFGFGMVILTDGLRKETRTLSGNGPGILSFSDETITPFPAGTRVNHAREGRLQAQPMANRLTNNAGALSYTLDIEPGSWAMGPGEPGPIFGGHELWPFKPNWAGGSEVNYFAPLETVDYGYGRVEHFRPIPFNTRLTKHEYISRTKADADQFVRFFNRMKGRHREFLLSTGESDIPYYALAGGSNSVLIQGEQFAYDFSDNSVFRRVLFRRRNGQDFTRLVDYLEPLPDTDSTAMWLTEPLPTSAIAPADIYGCSWCNVSRFASDMLEIEWPIQGVAQFAVTFQSLENFEL